MLKGFHFFPRKFCLDSLWRYFFAGFVLSVLNLYHCNSSSRSNRNVSNCSKLKWVVPLCVCLRQIVRWFIPCTLPLPCYQQNNNLYTPKHSTFTHTYITGTPCRLLNCTHYQHFQFLSVPSCVSFLSLLCQHVSDSEWNGANGPSPCACHTIVFSV